SGSATKAAKVTKMLLLNGLTRLLCLCQTVPSLVRAPHTYPNCSSKKHMKTPRWFTRTRFFSLVRITSASTLLTAAAAMAFVAIKPPGPTLASSQDRLRVTSKFRGDRDAAGGNKRTLPGIDRDGGPLLAAMEDYAHRAYPAKDVPMSATINALAGFKHVQRMSMGRGSAGGSSGTWQLVGPDKANVPDILTFSGAQYFTSGRVTALAID